VSQPQPRPPSRGAPAGDPDVHDARRRVDTDTRHAVTSRLRCLTTFRLV